MTPSTSNVIQQQTARLIAFYLPQFHTIPENDAWWGEGFTEWTNVRKAQSLYPGHLQPRIPGELGYYDLNDSTILEKQSAMARQHGIEGFCYHYYYFGKGKRLLEMPVDRLLQNQKPDFPFCLCWANENWTRTWDGGDNMILMQQSYLPEDLEGFALSVSPFFKDPRYIRVDGKPLLVIYNTRSIPETKSTLTQLRTIWRNETGLDVHISAALTFGETAPMELGVDSAVEFPPHNVRNANLPVDAIGFHEEFHGTVWDYHAHVLNSIAEPDRPYPYFPTVVTDWDNTARRGHRGSLFVNGNPIAYQQWLISSIRRSVRCNKEDSRLVFINAWNEWAEGTYLEPDNERGFSYLQATKAANTNGDPMSHLLDSLTGSGPLDPATTVIFATALRNYSNLFSSESNPANSWFQGFKDRYGKMSHVISDLAGQVRNQKAKLEKQRSKNDKLRIKAEEENQRRKQLEGSMVYRALSPLIQLEGKFKGQPSKNRHSKKTSPVKTPALPSSQHSPTEAAKSIKWLDDSSIQIENATLLLASDQDLHLLDSSPKEFILGKTTSMVHLLLGWIDEIRPKRIVDIGVFKGGSVVFLHASCTPEKLVAIERNTVKCEPLEEYLKTADTDNSVSVRYGVDQADLSALESIYSEEFGNENIDMVIDDASHFLYQTRESFRFFFPRLRPGGYYIIEDWGWAHWPEDCWQKEKGGEYFKNKDPLSNLLMELMILSASAPDVVESLWVNKNQVLVKRGPRKLESPFSPEAFVLNREIALPKIP
ncbi:MAG: glycoside hydrolase family 99-like domain-containing protein [Verrucomicrobiales bacterium]